MPVLDLKTNISADIIPKEFDLQLCGKVVEVLNKPLQLVNLTVTTDLRQVRAGSAEPMVILSIHSIADFDEQRNPTYTPQLLGFLCEKLNLAPSRVLILYFDFLPHQIGKQV